MQEVDAEALDTMRNNVQPDEKWAVYENQAMDSATCGHLQFLKIGERCTFKSPPSQMPDTKAGLGWKYRFVGYVNLTTGAVEKSEA